MLESTPGSPYTGSIQDLLSVESNMHYRREIRTLELCLPHIEYQTPPRQEAPQFQ